MGKITGKIRECGNRLAGVGDYVAGSDGELYLVTAAGRHETGRSPGAGDWCEAEAELADWAELSEVDADDVVCSFDPDPDPDERDQVADDLAAYWERREADADDHIVYDAHGQCLGRGVR